MDVSRYITDLRNSGTADQRRTHSDEAPSTQQFGKNVTFRQRAELMKQIVVLLTSAGIETHVRP